MLSVCELPELTRLTLVALEFVAFLIVKGAFVDAPEVSWLIPSLPPSFIVKTSEVLSNTFNKSAVPVPLMYATGLLLLSETIAKSPRVLWKLWYLAVDV